MVVQVGRDVVGGELLQDLLLQGGLLVGAVGAVAPAAVQDLDAVAQVLAAGHAVVVGVVAVERQRVHDAGVAHVVQNALFGRHAAGQGKAGAISDESGYLAITVVINVCAGEQVLC